MLTALALDEDGRIAELLYAADHAASSRRDKRERFVAARSSSPLAYRSQNPHHRPAAQPGTGAEPW